MTRCQAIAISSHSNFPDSRSWQSAPGGPVFRFNPSVSFHVKCKTKDEVEAIRKKFSEGGKVLMPLGSYFSDRYGWVEDKYRLSWQVIFAGGSEISRRSFPCSAWQNDTCHPNMGMAFGLRTFCWISTRYWRNGSLRKGLAACGFLSSADHD